MTSTSPIFYIRKTVLDVTQAELAAIASVSQATVSKWEAGELEPDRQELARIRDAVKKRGLKWNDGWFFEAPPARPAHRRAAS